MSRIKIAFACVAAVALITVNAVLLAWVWLAQTNTPENRAAWVLSKSLHPSLPGVQACESGPQLYAGGQLNLHAWHGHQEVLFHEPVRLAKVSFRFKTCDRGYVAFIGYNQAGLFDAFRFSGWEDKRSALLRGHRSGRFTDKTVGTPAIFYPYHWHDAELYFEQGAMTIYVDGEGITQIPTRLVDLAQVGFRGGLGEAQVDNVTIETADGTVISEDFENTAGFAAKITSIFFLQAALLLLILLVMRTKKKDWEALSGGLFATAALLLLISVVLYHWHSLVYTTQYPASHHRVFDADPKVARESAEIRTRIFENEHGIEKTPDEFRVLILGASFTPGDEPLGGDDFATYTGKYLAALLPNTKTRVMDGTSRKVNAVQMLDFYESTLRAYQPDIMVVNLGGTGEPEGELENALDTLLDLNGEDGVQTIFMLQPVSPEHPQPRPAAHDTIRKVAEARNAAVVDAYNTISRLHDSGFLFWDYLHPTPYGHDAISQSLLPILQRHIENLAKNREEGAEPAGG